MFVLPIPSSQFILSHACFSRRQKHFFMQVIFSQSSDLMERQSSMASSTEEVSGANNDLSGGSRRDDEQFGVFKDFDFLEYESESVEVSYDTSLYLFYSRIIYANLHRSL